MVFASIRELASTAIFLPARAEIKKFALRAASSEHFLYFPLTAIHMEILFFLNKTEDILKRGFHLECTKFCEASLSDTSSRSNQ